MRVAYVCQSYPPMVSGAAIAVQRLAHGMAGRGNAVLVLAASDQGQPYVEAHNGLHLVRLRSFPNPFRVGQRFALYPRGAILAALKSFRPDVLHAHDPLGVGLTGIMAARFLHIPTVLTTHQLPWFVAAYLPPWPGLQQAAEAGLWRYARWLARRCDRLIAPSHTIAEIMRTRGAGCPVAISNGLDLNTFTPRPAAPDEAAALRRKYDLAPDLPVILHVGRIDADKQVERVVRATARALRSVKAQLLIVGDGKRREAVLRLSEALGIRAHSHFPGFVSATGDLPGLYRLASVFVTASEIETQCLVAMEALAAGTPVVAVRTSVLAELVEEGVNGFLVMPRDVEAMSERLVHLLQNPDHARALGQAGRKLVERHSLIHALDAHENLYRSLKERWKPVSG